MKTVSKLIFALLLISAFVSAQDTLYVVKSDSTFMKIGIADIKQITFVKPQESGTTTDSEGNVYHWITIGNQTWMVENLRTTKYRNGESVKNITDNTEWANLLYTDRTPGWCDYNNNPANGSKYGKLYNWYAVNDQRNIAPVGWHVASSGEWLVMLDYLNANGYNYDETVSTTGNKLAKSIASTTDWVESSVEGSPGNNASKNNLSGFNALPVGVRSSNGAFYGLGTDADWWTSTAYNYTTDIKAYNHGMSYNNSYVQEGQRYGTYNTYNFGFSVRCVRNSYESYAPVITTQKISQTGNTVQILSQITDDGNEPILRHNNTNLWECGICWSNSPNPSLADNVIYSTDYQNIFQNLPVEAGKTYYVRAFAANTMGTGYSNEISFVANNFEVIKPTVSTDSVFNITQTSVSCAGKIISTGNGTITERGVCWSTGSTPTIADNKQVDNGTMDVFSVAISNLTAGTIYYASSYATNSAGISYGDIKMFKTVDPPLTATDADGNVYNTIKIGNQIWMLENLRTTKYRNGESVKNITDNAEWSNLLYTDRTPGWCDYNNDPANGSKYGKLYNWYAVNDQRNIAPVGWHVASSGEWLILLDFLNANGYNYDGSVSTTGNKLAKSIASKTDWTVSTVQGAPGNNLAKNNTSGFIAFPAGVRSSNGTFYGVGTDTDWWTSTAYNYTTDIKAYNHGMTYNNSYVQEGQRFGTYNTYNFGFSVRCVKD